MSNLIRPNLTQPANIINCIYCYLVKGLSVAVTENDSIPVVYPNGDSVRYHHECFS